MRVLLFGSGSPASLIALQVLNRSATITGVVVPGKRKTRFWQRSPAAPLVELARREHLPVYPFDARQQQSLVDDLSRAEAHPDLICVATFPSILRREVLQVAAGGGINIHWSLLPKHRGPDPLFWTYVEDDRTTGVTLHWLAERADAGPILLQRDIPLARGRPLLDVYRELAAIGGELFASAISLIRSGRSPRVTQDEEGATHEPSRAAGNWQVNAAHWPAERVWHVLRGLTRCSRMPRESRWLTGLRVATSLASTIACRGRSSEPATDGVCSAQMATSISGRRNADASGRCSRALSNRCSGHAGSSCRATSYEHVVPDGV